MPSFSSSEISSMISSKKYKVKRGDSLSVLADKFQSGFPSTKCVNKSSLMDKIYNMNKSAFFGSKDLLFEGAELDLKFICEYRDNLKFDKTKSEYTFTDEDKLVFAIKGANSFWDDFIKFDRSIGESMKQTFRNAPGSSLPKSLPLPIIPKSSSNNKKLMEEIKRSLSGSTVTTNQIVEGFFKLMEHSPTSSQVNSIAIQLEKENNSCRQSNNSPCMVIKDKLEQLSAKIFEETYLKIPLSSSDKTNLEKGFYKPTKLDKLIFSINIKYFWNRLYTDSGDNALNIEARRGVGLTVDKLEGDKIFVATKLGLDKIAVSNKSGVSGTISTTNITRLKIIGLYANYLANSRIIKTILISDIARTPITQAGLVYKDALNYPNINDTNAMYKYGIGKLARKLIQENTETQEITTQLTNYIIKNPAGFRHVDNSGNTIDIAANDTRDTANTNFNISFKKFMTNDKLISSSNSIPKGIDGETDAYHTVFK